MAGKQWCCTGPTVQYPVAMLYEQRWYTLPQAPPSFRRTYASLQAAGLSTNALHHWGGLSSRTLVPPTSHVQYTSGGDDGGARGGTRATEGNHTADIVTQVHAFTQIGAHWGLTDSLARFQEILLLLQSLRSGVHANLFHLCRCGLAAESWRRDRRKGLLLWGDFIIHS